MLINKSLANKEVATEYGTIKFNDKGESTDLNAEQTKKLAKLPGFSTKEEKKEEKKQEVKKAEKGKAENAQVQVEKPAKNTKKK